MDTYVMDFVDIDRADVALVGGKAASLGELSRIEGIRVPPGFCVTTDAFRRIDTRTRPIAIPDDVTAAIVRALSRFAEHTAFAVRSSATAEDLPTASFAGQYDTFLNVVGAAAVLEHITLCWASLFAERAVAYRERRDIDDRKVRMAVIVQQMVAPHAAGVLFTADPVTGNRKVSAIEAVFGLAEDLVSGAVNPDVYKVRDGDGISVAQRQAQRPLTDAQIARLAQLGRRIESHFGSPQDIEWCLADDDFHIVQSRPITTLFPIPAAAGDEPRVYVSVGHGQMMTDAVKPLGISVRQLTGATVFHEAGGRWFVDVSRALASATGRAGLLNVLGKGDPLIGDALETIIERDFIPLLPDQTPGGPPRGEVPARIATDPAIVAALVERSEASIAALKRHIATRSGPALLDFILADFEELKRILFDPLSHQAIMAGMEAAWWLNDHLQAWLGEKNAADVLTRSVPDNVTSEMGLALMDVADVIRPHADVIAFLQRVNNEYFLNDLASLAGGREARDAIRAWLDRYGMRGPGEIDLTRPRWSECPSMLLPVLLGNVRNFEPGESKRRFARGKLEAMEKERELLRRLRELPDGAQKAEETKRMIDRVRTFAGYREYPKYGMVSRYFVYKQALTNEAGRLVEAGVLRARDDIFYLRFEELHEVVRTKQVDEKLLRSRREAFEFHQSLAPPRVMTSEGEVITGVYRRADLPTGALAGLAVSAGTIEGRARVIRDMAAADLEPGDILVTTYTDPSWTPLFVAIGGLVTEVGGQMTHGAVIAREYGLPAVVGVEHATTLIRDGQRIRVHGTAGYVELVGGGAVSLTR